jgi:hypothetical protein
MKLLPTTKKMMTNGLTSMRILLIVWIRFFWSSSAVSLEMNLSVLIFLILISCDNIISHSRTAWRTPQRRWDVFIFFNKLMQ